MQLKRKELEELLRLALEKNRELEGNNQHLLKLKHHAEDMIQAQRGLIIEALESFESDRERGVSHQELFQKNASRLRMVRDTNISMLAKQLRKEGKL